MPVMAGIARPTTAEIVTGAGNAGKELKIGIIGGGYAGMAAAVTLAAQRIPVTVFESAKQLGGRARGEAFRASVQSGRRRMGFEFAKSPHAD